MTPFHSASSSLCSYRQCSRFQIQYGFSIPHSETRAQPAVWRLIEAQSYAERSLEINKKTFGPDHPKVANTLALLAYTGSYRKNPPEGMILLERARAIYERAGRSRTKKYATVLHNIAFCAQRTGDFTYAGSMFSKVLDLYRQILPPEDPGARMVFSQLSRSPRWTCTGRNLLSFLRVKPDWERSNRGRGYTVFDGLFKWLVLLRNRKGRREQISGL